MGQEQFGKGNYLVSLKEMGVWKDVPFDAANFYAAGSLVWMVTLSNININRYCRIGNVIIWNIWIAGSTLSGTASNSIYIISPTPDKIAKYSKSTGVAGQGSATGLISVGSFPKAGAIPAYVGIAPVPISNFTLGSSFSVNFTMIYEYGNAAV